MHKEILELCGNYYRREQFANWAVANCRSMQDVWNKADPQYLVLLAMSRDVLSIRKKREFKCACALEFEDRWDDFDRNCINTVRRLTVGCDSKENMASAHAKHDEFNHEQRGIDGASYETAVSVMAASASYPENNGEYPPRDSKMLSIYLESIAAKCSWGAAARRQSKWLRKNATPRF